MKAKVFAFSVFFAVLMLVSLNTYFIRQSIDEIILDIEAINLDGEIDEAVRAGASELYDDFKGRESYISLTVSHSDLMSINDSLSEFVGYISVGDKDGAKVTKSRLINALEHLKRLSGFNIDSII